MDYYIVHFQSLAKPSTNYNQQRTAYKYTVNRSTKNLNNCSVVIKVIIILLIIQFKKYICTTYILMLYPYTIVTIALCYRWIHTKHSLRQTQWEKKFEEGQRPSDSTSNISRTKTSGYFNRLYAAVICNFVP
jgi:hypothetical protein